MGSDESEKANETKKKTAASMHSLFVIRTSMRAQQQLVPLTPMFGVSTASRTNTAHACAHWGHEGRGTPGCTAHDLTHPEVGFLLPRGIKAWL